MYKDFEVLYQAHFLWSVLDAVNVCRECQLIVGTKLIRPWEITSRRSCVTAAFSKSPLFEKSRAIETSLIFSILDLTVGCPACRHMRLTLRCSDFHKFDGQPYCLKCNRCLSEYRHAHIYCCWNAFLWNYVNYALAVPETSWSMRNKFGVGSIWLWIRHAETNAMHVFLSQGCLGTPPAATRRTSKRSLICIHVWHL